MQDVSVSIPILPSNILNNATEKMMMNALTDQPISIEEDKGFHQLIHYL